MTSEERREEAARYLVETFGRWHSGDIDTEELMTCVEDELRALSRAEGQDGVLPWTVLTDIACLAKEAYEAQYRTGNVSRIMAKMAFDLENGDARDSRGPRGGRAGAALAV